MLFPDLPVPGFSEPMQTTQNLAVVKMTKKKPRGPSQGARDTDTAPAPSSTASSSSQKTKTASKPTPEPSVPPTLVICRNKYMALDPIRGRIPWIGLLPNMKLTLLPGTGATSRPTTAPG